MIERVEFIEAGYCTHPERVVMRGGRFSSCRFPALVAILHHKRRGPILFDTGYSHRFFDETRHFPASIYARITPVFLEERQTAAEQLLTRGIRARDVEHLILSHFHADHIAGARDFERATFYYLAEAWAEVRGRSGFSALLRGFLPGLVPTDLEERGVEIEGLGLRPLPPELAPFTHGFDLFDDESVLAVPLPGHVAGHFGILVRVQTGEQLFLISDAAWTSRSFRELRPPSAAAGIIMDSAREYRATLRALNTLYSANPEVLIVPAHCDEVRAKLGVACAHEHAA